MVTAVIVVALIVLAVGCQYYLKKLSRQERTRRLADGR